MIFAEWTTVSPGGKRPTFLSASTRYHGLRGRPEADKDSARGVSLGAIGLPSFRRLKNNHPAVFAARAVGSILFKRGRFWPGRTLSCLHLPFTLTKSTFSRSCIMDVCAALRTFTLNSECGTGDRMIMQHLCGLNKKEMVPCHSVMHRSLYGWYQATCNSPNPMSIALPFWPCIKPLCYAVELAVYAKAKVSTNSIPSFLPPSSLHFSSL